DRGPIRVRNQHGWILVVDPAKCISRMPNACRSAASGAHDSCKSDRALLSPLVGCCGMLGLVAPSLLVPPSIENRPNVFKRQLAWPFESRIFTPVAHRQLIDGKAGNRHLVVIERDCLLELSIRGLVLSWSLEDLLLTDPFVTGTNGLER